MKKMLKLAICSCVLMTATLFAKDVINVQIIFDNSGSMRENADRGGSSKYESGRKALMYISQMLSVYSVANVDTELKVGITIFDGNEALSYMPTIMYNKETMRNAINKLPPPAANTPLGEALTLAYDAIKKDASNGAKCHIFVITDGDENGKTRMENVIIGNASNVGLYFVAFNIEADRFVRLAKLGAKITHAGNEKELMKEADTIFSKNILLEREE